MTTYAPKLLRANLTTGTMKEEVIPQKVVVDFVGGRGFGIKYLYQELSPGIDPLSPANKLLFTIGPLAGTGALSFSRWMVTTKSPLTDTYFRSVAGADFGAWLRFAGLDMIIVEGKSDKPVYLYIEDGRYEIKDAGELWGQETEADAKADAQQRGQGLRAQELLYLGVGQRVVDVGAYRGREEGRNQHQSHQGREEEHGADPDGQPLAEQRCTGHPSRFPQIDEQESQQHCLLAL